jgi:excisionase family DNA binding protein
MLLTSRELAQELGLSPRTIRRMAANGEIPALRVGRFKGRWRFELENVRAQMVADGRKWSRMTKSVQSAIDNQR